MSNFHARNYRAQRRRTEAAQWGRLFAGFLVVLGMLTAFQVVLADMAGSTPGYPTVSPCDWSVIDDTGAEGCLTPTTTTEAPPVTTTEAPPTTTEQPPTTTVPTPPSTTVTVPSTTTPVPEVPKMPAPTPVPATPEFTG